MVFSAWAAVPRFNGRRVRPVRLDDLRRGYYMTVGGRGSALVQHAAAYVTAVTEVS